VGEAEKRLYKVFNTAKALAPSIIFIDEIDGLTHTRTSSKPEQGTHTLVTAFVTAMNGLVDRGEVSSSGPRIDPTTSMKACGTCLHCARTSTVNDQFVGVHALTQQAARPFRRRGLFSHARHAHSEANPEDTNCWLARSPQ
jgi:hypothetical protein